MSTDRTSAVSAVETERLATLTRRGAALLKSGDAAGAIALFQQAMSEDPAHHRDYVLSATESYHRALPLDPQHAAAFRTIGLAYADLGEHQRAIAALGEALTVAPEDAETHISLAMELLLLGDFAAGWPAYEWRRRLPSWGGPAQRQYRGPPWRGEPLAGAPIVLYAEQGLGDTLQFLRYAPLVAERGGKVVLFVPPPLERLCRTAPGIATVISDPTSLPDAPWHCPLLSLPLAFGTTPPSVPRRVPYLQADSAASEAWRRRLPGGFRVGLVWAGAGGYRQDARRSLALPAFVPLARIAGVTLVSLQKGPAAWHLRRPPAGMLLVDAGSELNDFADTAAAIAALDLVISVDTSVAHLAGALGKPVWVLLPFAPDWRWLLDRSDSPWYPTMRLFRQPAPGDWPAVIAETTAALRQQTSDDGEQTRCRGDDVLKADFRP